MKAEDEYSALIDALIDLTAQLFRQRKSEIAAEVPAIAKHPDETDAEVIARVKAGLSVSSQTEADRENDLCELINDMRTMVHRLYAQCHGGPLVTAHELAIVDDRASELTHEWQHRRLMENQ